MLGLLQLGRAHGPANLLGAIDAALALGCTDAAAVRHLVEAQHRERTRPDALDLAPFAALVPFERPLPTVGAYDQLLTSEVAR